MGCMVLTAGVFDSLRLSADGVIVIFISVGVIVLANWLINQRGFASLAGAPVRSNRLPAYVPFVIIAGWILLSMVILHTAEELLSTMPDEIVDLFSFIAVAVVEMFLILVIMAAAAADFEGGLKGFGLDFRRIGRDIFPAIINFTAVYPLVVLMIFIVGWIGLQIQGSDFQMQQNEGITALSQSGDWRGKFILAVCFIGVVPVFEELVFRGLLQSAVRSFFIKPWPAILFTSAAFAVLHPPMHWPALFVLGAGFGYAYEKSGSLLRPIIMHSLFNAMSITFVLVDSAT